MNKNKSKVYVIVCDKEIKGIALKDKQSAIKEMKRLINIHYSECYLNKISKEMYKFIHKWEAVKTSIID